MDTEIEDDDEHGGRLEETKRIARILRMIGLITNGPRRWTRAKLAATFERSERQIDKDFELLRHMGFALEHTREGYYFSEAPELRAIRYTPAEALALLGALTLAQGSGALDAASLGAALARTEEALPGEFLDLARALRRRAVPRTERQRRRAEIYGLAQTALAEGRRLRVVYESAEGPPRERELCPYHLEPYEGSWLLTAHDSLRGEVRYFKLDRVLRATVLDARYTIPADFDPEKYRGTGWGILRGMAGEPVEVVLHLDAAEGRRVRDDERHASQREEPQADGTWIVRFHVGIDPELVRWLFRWGTGCEVLSPPELRAMVAEQARRIAALHGDSGDVSHFASGGGKQEGRE